MNWITKIIKAGEKIKSVIRQRASKSEIAASKYISCHGVPTEKTINSLKKADGLVVGSAICKEITNSIKKRQNAVTNVTNVVKRLLKKIK